MSKKANPTLIGAFVVGAIVLVIGAVTILGSGRLFRKTYEFVLYFEGSVSGLREGAPVKYKGVEIGSITKILLQLDEGAEVNRIPVIIKLDADKISGRGVGGSLADPAGLKAAIDRGLRGQLQTESIVTGVLFVALDLFPDSPAKFVQPPGSRYPEIPTIPTTLQKAQDILGQLLTKLDDVDFKVAADLDYRRSYEYRRAGEKQRPAGSLCRGQSISQQAGVACGHPVSRSNRAEN